jgi:hypothetical protein
MDTFTGALTRFAAGAAFVAVIYSLAALLLGCRTIRAVRRKDDLFHPPSREPGIGGTEKSDKE